ncbi:hypothetical protein [Acidovorax sp. CCYZU-2555]|uniref:hypothetical protein n=1 Tax=Acidovorax sp. CCYZU-2555 TaxID=2835042 RepID=UPI001BD0D978|nr:hypothetical protein [Acidovorax sp. CCYZU-2555]MBS7777528.1 hypothetical protein [Acidovorax sp. CCYZU-2555]
MTTISSAGPQVLNLASISASDIATVKNASDRDHIGGLGSRIWDKVSDMFFGTDREQAKKCLFDMYMPNTPDAQKIDSFLTLQSLAGDGYKDRFQHTIENGVETYALLLDGDEKGEGILLTRKVFDCDLKAINATIASNGEVNKLAVQATKDITRGSYYIDGKPLPDDVTLSDTARTEAKLSALDGAMDALNCTAAEKETVLTLANQALFGLIMANTERTGGLPPLCPTSEGQVTEYRISREDGVIRLRALCTQDVDHVQDEDMRAEKKEAVSEAPHMHKSLEMRIDIAIQADGRAETRKLDVLANKG